MPINNATILGGPALVQFRGASFYSKGNILLTNAKGTFPVETDRFGKVDERVSNEDLKVSFEPAGEFENLAVLWPYGATVLGALIAPASQAVVSIDTATDIITLTGHGYTTEDQICVHMSTGGTLPAATPTLTTVLQLFVRNVSANTVTLHDTAAHATANTNLVNFSDSGTGTLYLDKDFPLVIWTFSGVKLTLYNAAVTKMPSMNLSAVKTIIGGVEFSAFTRNGYAITTAASKWAIANAALSDTTFAPASVLTQAYTAAWGSAPWDSFQTKDGFVVDFNLGLRAVETDADGVRTMQLTSLDVTAKATPAGIDESQLLTKLLLQDTGSGRGRSLSGDNLLLSGAGANVFVQLYGAALKQSNMNFSSGLERMGELTWFATRTFSAGVPNPLFYVGAVTP